MVKKFKLWIMGLFNNEPHKPSYAEVWNTLTSEEARLVLNSYSVIFSSASDEFRRYALSRLTEVAKKHSWDYSTFEDIVNEEYITLYIK